MNGRTTDAVGSEDLADDLGLVERAAVREGRVGVQELERRGRVEALADPGLEHFALLDGLAEAVDLPLVGRDDARRFAREVDLGRRAEPELPRPVRQAVDPEPLATW